MRGDDTGYIDNMRIDPALCHQILILVESDPKAGTGEFIRDANFVGAGGTVWRTVADRSPTNLSTRSASGGYLVFSRGHNLQRRGAP